MEHDDTCKETDKGNELKSPTEVMNNSESSDHIPSPAEAPNKPESSELKIPSSEVVLCTPELEVLKNPESSDYISSPAVVPDKPESSELKIPSSVEVLSKPKLELSNNPESSNHIPSAAEMPTEQVSSELKIPSSAENKMSSPAEATITKKKSPNSLKGKAKIVKKPLSDKSLKASKATSSSQVNNAKRKRFRNKGNNKREDAKKMNSGNGTQQKNSDDQQTDKNHQSPKNKGKAYESETRQQKNTEKRPRPDKSVKNEIKGKKPDEKREKLGGLIFMCSDKTRPDCFRYRIMGISQGKKDTVLGIKRGLKLFLYDIDLKLLYGVFKASSSGGLKLEPKAFGGAFPAQVRFSVEKDCNPIPESVLKKAIKENYDAKNKFKTELTVRQVRKLTALFRPAPVPLSSQPTHAPLLANTRDREKRGRNPDSRSHRDARARDTYHNGDSRRILAHERDQHAAYQDVASIRREEIPRDLYLSEKEYRAYGLQGDRRNLAPRPVSPAVEAHRRDYDREPVRQPNLIYVEAALAHRETLLDPLYLNEKEYAGYTAGARHELPPATSALAADLYARDPYYRRYYGASTLDHYGAPQRREDVPLGSYYTGGRRESYPGEHDPIERRALDLVERSSYLGHAPSATAVDDHIGRSLYSARAATSADDRYGRSLYSAREASALDADTRLDYNRRETYPVSKPEAQHAPVSSRYAFAGASYSYR